MIELRNVSKRFGMIHALQNVTLKVQKGEIFTVIGPNGSGKTTMLRIMAGIERHTSGEMRFGGERVVGDNLSKVRKNCTLVFQKTALFNTTVYKNVAYGLKLRQYPNQEIEEKVRDVLKMVKLDDYEKRWAKKLSGGEQQRVSLARALAVNTDVLLLDEPTANLDPKNVSIIEGTISRVNRERGTTVIMATHNMFQAETLTDRAALLISGKIAQMGTPREIFGTPSEHMASFARLENVFSGVSRVLREGTSVIDLGDNVTIEAAIRREGEVTLFVRPEDIILSKEQLVSSARNVFRGEVTGISGFGGTVKLRVDMGKEFVVQITKRSFTEMQLNIGSEIFLAFKATAVRVV
ncbi:MAG: ABC transporter ATP-binding protein [Candidatus Bathyarchaeota archaeon]|nr:ABC transporter ATP-binding protein [Candidatus Bathyarchaeota archaeon]